MPPPQLESTPHVTLLFKWLSDNWAQITGTMGGIAIAGGILVRLGKRKKEYETLQITVGLMETNQKKVIGLIPKESWENGIMLINQNTCNSERTDCRTRILVEEYKNTLDIVKQAVGLLITHNKDIPEDEKNKAIQALMK